MTAADENWIEENLLGQSGTRFERLGPKRVIFKADCHVPMVSLYLDPPPAPSVGWSSVSGCSRSQAFFVLLAPMMEQHPCTFFCAFLNPDHHAALIKAGPLRQKMWNIRVFLTLRFDAARGRTPIVGYTIGTEAVLVFTLKHGLEIAFYGSEELWQSVSDALYGAGA